MFNSIERETLLSKYPQAESLIHRFVGAAEFIKGELRYCLYIHDNEKDLAYSIPEIASRLEKVRNERLKSKKKPTQLMAEYPYKYTEDRFCENASLFVPLTSSETREYIPIGYLPENTIVSNAGFAIYNCETYIFGIITSKLHLLWNNTLAGKMETRLRYSSSLSYNTFPFPKISAEKKAEIEAAAEEVLVTREFYPDKTLADLYDPDKMPQALREAHEKLDDIVESCYPGYPFASDEARLECLFKLYEKMTTKK